MQNAEYAAIVAYLQRGTIPKQLPSTKSNFVKKANKYQLRGESLYRNGLQVVRYAERKKIFDAFHDHRGRDKCVHLIRQRYFWQGGYKYIAEQTKKCVACSYKKSKR